MDTYQRPSYVVRTADRPGISFGPPMDPAMMAGLPPGAVLIHGPPPGSTATFPPQGLPPGAVLLPPGAPLPPGAQLIQGPPPPGSVMVAQAPPPPTPPMPQPPPGTTWVYAQGPPVQQPAPTYIQQPHPPGVMQFVPGHGYVMQQPPPQNLVLSGPAQFVVGPPPPQPGGPHYFAQGMPMQGHPIQMQPQYQQVMVGQPMPGQMIPIAPTLVRQTSWPGQNSADGTSHGGAEQQAERSQPGSAPTTPALLQEIVESPTQVPAEANLPVGSTNDEDAFASAAPARIDSIPVTRIRKSSAAEKPSSSEPAPADHHHEHHHRPHHQHHRPSQSSHSHSSSSSHTTTPQPIPPPQTSDPKDSRPQKKPSALHLSTASVAVAAELPSHRRHPSAASAQDSPPPPDPPARSTVPKPVPPKRNHSIPRASVDESPPRAQPPEQNTPPQPEERQHHRHYSDRSSMVQARAPASKPSNSNMQQRQQAQPPSGPRAPQAGLWQPNIVVTEEQSEQSQAQNGDQENAYQQQEFQSQSNEPVPSRSVTPMDSVRSNQNHFQPQPHTQSQMDDTSSIHSAATVRTVTPMPHIEALELYRQNAKKSNDPQVQLDFAKYLIATAETFPVDTEPDPRLARKQREMMFAEGLKWIKKLATQGNGIGKSSYPEAMFFLAECYGNGSLGLQVDHEKAFNLYVNAAKQNHPAATYRTAVCYEVGAGTKRDAPRAVQFYRKAGALGDTAAMYKLGMILLNGLLKEQRNPREAITWLKRAANQADETTPHALHELGLLYEGKGSDAGGNIIPDPAYAHDLFLKAAQLGYAPSQYKLGLCYEYGLLNVNVDSRRSIAWYTRAAEQGEPEAELALSGWYLTGADETLSQSDTEAYLWARKAADKGLAKAEYAVGYYSEHGVGVRPDLEEAVVWYTRAAGQGNKRAVQRLGELNGGVIPTLPSAEGAKSGEHGSHAKGEWRDTGDAKNGECSVM